MVSFRVKVWVTYIVFYPTGSFVLVFIFEPCDYIHSLVNTTYIAFSSPKGDLGTTTVHPHSHFLAWSCRALTSQVLYVFVVCNHPLGDRLATRPILLSSTSALHICLPVKAASGVKWFHYKSYNFLKYDWFIQQSIFLNLAAKFFIGECF